MNSVQVSENGWVEQVVPIVLGADPAINWLFIQVVDDAGHIGLGEATLERRNEQVATLVEATADAIAGQGLDEALRITAEPARDLAHAAALSGLNQALWDLRARRADQSLSELISGMAASSPALYANINRAIVGDRSPAAFARVAQAAQADGYSALKIAPFDDVAALPLSDTATRRAVDAGMERIAAVLDAVQIEVRVDLHWRFEVAAAVEVVAELAALPLGWVEAPVREGDLEAWRRVRDSTGCVLAGGETLTSAAEFDAFLGAARVDITMPDIKYCGGVSGFRQCLQVSARHGARVSPHNPSGPVATLATLHAAGAAELHSLEVPWREQPSPIDVIESGALVLPTGPGLGYELPSSAPDRFPAHPEPQAAPSDLI